MNWKAAATVKVTKKTRGLEKAKEPLLGADNKPMETASYRFAKLTLGDVEFPKPQLFMADLPVFETLGIADGPAMIFGIDMFAGRVLVLDYKEQTLHVSAVSGDAKAG